MPTIKRTLLYIILSLKGGENRAQIIELLRRQPYNLNQMAEMLNLNYRTVKHHIDVLKDHGIVTSSSEGEYGEIYFLSPEMEENIVIFDEIVKKMMDITATPKFFQNVMEQTNDAVMIIDNGGVVLFWNDSAERIFGYSKDEIVGECVPVFPKEGFLEKIMGAALEGKRIVTHETKGRHKNGAILDIGIRVDTVEDKTETAVAFTIIARDVGERMRAEKAIAASEMRYRRLFEAAKDGILILDANTGVVVDVNPFLTEKLGYSHKEFCGKKVWEIGFLKDVVANEAKFRELQQKGYVHYEDLPLETRNGQRMDVEFVSNVYEVNNQKVIQCNIREITERKIAEEESSRYRLQLENSLEEGSKDIKRTKSKPAKKRKGTHRQ